MRKGAAATTRPRQPARDTVHTQRDVRDTVTLMTRQRQRPCTPQTSNLACSRLQTALRTIATTTCETNEQRQLHDDEPSVRLTSTKETQPTNRSRSAAFIIARRHVVRLQTSQTNTNSKNKSAKNSRNDHKSAQRPLLHAHHQNECRAMSTLGRKVNNVRLWRFGACVVLLLRESDSLPDHSKLCHT